MHKISSSNKVRVGFVANKDIHDRANWSGTVSFLAEQLSKEYDVVPLVVSDTPKRIFRKILEILHLSWFWSFPSLWERFVLKHKISHASPDILFGPAASELLTCGGIPDTLPVIYLSDATYHLMIDYYFFDVPLDKRQAYNKIEKEALQNAEVIIESSSWAAKDVVEYYGIDLKKVYVLPFGGNLPDCYTLIRKPLGKIVRLLLVGTDWERKGINIAVDTVRKLNSNAQQAHYYELSIVGVNAPSEIDESYIHFVGRLDKNAEDDMMQLVGHYQESDIFILPTKAECAGIVFSEAAMYGLPVFTFATGGVGTYVESGVTGECLPQDSTPDDYARAIGQLVADNRKYLEYSQNARRKYEKELNWNSWLKAFAAIVSAVTDEQRSIKHD